MRQYVKPLGGTKLPNLVGSGGRAMYSVDLVCDRLKLGPDGKVSVHS